METQSPSRRDTAVEVRTARDDGMRTTPLAPRPAGLAPRPVGTCAMAPTAPSFERSRVLRHNGAGWDGVRAVAEVDTTGARTGATRRILAPAAEAGFEVRYLEVEAGGEARLGPHASVRIVIGQRGHGRLRVGGEELELGYGDVVRIGPGESCGLINPNPEPFGLLCVMGTERDREQPLEVQGADA